MHLVGTREHIVGPCPSHITGILYYIFLTETFAIACRVIAVRRKHRDEVYDREERARIRHADNDLLLPLYENGEVTAMRGITVVL